MKYFLDNLIELLILEFFLWLEEVSIEEDIEEVDGPLI